MLSEIYEISDVLHSDAGVTGNKSNAWIVNGDVVVETTITGTKLSSNTSTDCYYQSPILLNGDFEITFVLVDAYVWEYQLAFYDENNNQKVLFGYNGSDLLGWINGNFNGRTSARYSQSKPCDIKIVREGSDYKFYYNDILKMTKTNNDTPVYFNFIEHSDASRYTKYKDLKIKAL